MICKNCGQEIEDNAKFCPFCGTAAADGEALPNRSKTEHPAMWSPAIIGTAAVLTALAVVAASYFGIVRGMVYEPVSFTVTAQENQ